MSFKLLSILALAASRVSAQAPADNLTAINTEWTNAGFAANNLSGFGLTLNANALLRVEYPGVGVIENGRDYTTTQVAQLPTVSFEPSSSANTLGAGRAYTLMLADASDFSSPDPEGNYRHYLANDADAVANGTGMFLVENGTVITSYAGPGPLRGSGVHRYAWMLFLQGSAFRAPSNLSAAGTAPSHWNVSSYVTTTGLQLVAASFFTVTAPGATAPTVPVGTNPIGGGSSTNTSTNTTTPTTPTSTNTSTTSPAANTPTRAPASGAEKLVGSSLIAASFGVVGLFALF